MADSDGEEVINGSPLGISPRPSGSSSVAERVDLGRVSPTRTTGLLGTIATSLELGGVSPTRTTPVGLSGVSPTRTQDDTTPYVDTRDNRDEVCLPEMDRTSARKAGGRENELQSSYDLLCEDDPDDFVNIEIPADSTNNDSNAPPLELLEMRRKGGGGFLENLRRNATMANRTVITGGRRVKGGCVANSGGKEKGDMERQSRALHEYNTEPYLNQEPLQEEQERESDVAENHLSSEDDASPTVFRQRHRSSNIIPGEDYPPAHLDKEGEREEEEEEKEEGGGSGDHLSAMLSESHKISHHHGQKFVDSVDQTGGVTGTNEGEELEGITAGIGLTTSTGNLPYQNNSDPSLSSDMLMSLNMGGPEMSLRQSLHIGVSPREIQVAKLKLPSNEEIAKEASRARIDSVESDQREYEDEDVESATWCEHRKHVFVLSLSGKPVYSRYGKEDKLVNLFGIMQALVSFVQDDNKDNLRSIVAGNHKLVFVCRGPLVFVSVSQTGQSETQLAIQLNYVYNQILSVLTHTQLTQIFEKSPGYDLRYQLQGSEKFVDNILNMSDRDPALTIGGIRCLSMSIPLRQMITSTIIQCRTKDVLFAVVVANNQVVTFIKLRDYNIVPIDIHIIINLVQASMNFRSAESWTPICLPKFNDSGFLHAHVSYLPNDSPACMLLFSTNKEVFFDLQDCQQRIIEKLERQSLLEPIKDAVKESNYNLENLQAPEIRHFLYKSRKTSCLTSPRIPPVYSQEEDEKRLFSMYMFMHERLHSVMWPTKILYHVGNKEAVLGWRTTGFDLYIVFDPLIIKAQAILLGNKLIKWISREEDKLIITSSYTF